MVTKIRSAIVFPDIQVPYQDTKAIQAVLQYASRQRWEYCVIIGDFLDLECLSGFVKGKPGAVEGQTLARDLEMGRGFLDLICVAVRKVNPACEVVLLEGNHEYRATRIAEESPHFKYELDIPARLELKAKNIKWVPSWSKDTLYRIGKAYFLHGRWTNEHHAKKHALRYGVNIFYGHTHDIQRFALHRKGDGQTIIGQSMGCLCRYNLNYTKGAPTNWQQAFGVFRFWPDGRFAHQLVPVFKKQLIGPDGILYGPEGPI